MIKVKKFQSHMHRGDMEPHWEAVIDYSGHEVTIPLPGRLLAGDTIFDQRREAAEAMERLARALLDFAAEMRKNDPRL
jgi:hypothetical protein